MSKVTPFDHRELLLMNVDYEKYPLLETHMECIAAVAAQGRSWFIEADNGQKLALIGIQKIWEGVANVYIVPSIEAHNVQATAFIKCVHTMRKEMDKRIGDLGLHRLQTSTPFDDTHQRWMEKLGFRLEGIMKSYGP